MGIKNVLQLSKLEGFQLFSSLLLRLSGNRYDLVGRQSSFFKRDHGGLHAGLAGALWGIEDRLTLFLQAIQMLLMIVDLRVDVGDALFLGSSSCQFGYLSPI